MDEECGIHAYGSLHSTKDDTEDVKKVTRAVMKQSLWEVKKGRKHYHFKNMSSNPLAHLNKEKLTNWMNKKITQYKKYRELKEGDVSDCEPYDSN